MSISAEPVGARALAPFRHEALLYSGRDELLRQVIVHRLCELVQIRSLPGGTVVRLRMDRRSG